MSETLVIHPDRFEDLAMAITNNLLLWGVVHDKDYDKSVTMIMRALRHQLLLHRTWTAEDEDSVKRFRADRANVFQEPLPRDGSNAV
jgi:hypothetical protein